MDRRIQMTNPVPPQLAALQTAIELAGSRRELARRIARHVPCTAGRLDMWFHRKSPVPVEIAPFISAAVDGAVSVFELCPEYSKGWRMLKELLNSEEPIRETA
ncbi:hypothetical protein [Paraburkholderia sp. EG304]|uniref:hypothetical protein n=1 Tax=unclassified Paraburkholderia TaxID=2615204 RepID=UPI00397C39F4